MTNNNKLYFQISLITHDTLVMQKRGTDENRVYKKVI